MQPGDPRTVPESTQLGSNFIRASGHSVHSLLHSMGTSCAGQDSEPWSPGPACGGLSSFVCKLGDRKGAWELAQQVKALGGQL